MIDLSVDLCGVRLKNPVIAASGTFGFGAEYDEYYDISLLGGISVKGLTLLPRQGNPPPRIAETAAGMLNSVGLQNPGLSVFLSDELPKLRQKNTVVIANVAGASLEDYENMAKGLQGADVDLVELNISCPNVKEGGVAFGIRPAMVEEVTKRFKKHCEQPLMVKLSPNVADITENARAAENGGADAVSLINTLTGMAIDIETRKPILANVTGGLSGPAVKPVALRMVYQVAKSVNIPVVGMGGIETGEDAVEFLLAGATAVMVGTANLSDPMACPKVIQGIEAYLERHHLNGVQEIIGKLEA